jgi:hypothetical protein
VQLVWETESQVELSAIQSLEPGAFFTPYPRGKRMPEDCSPLLFLGSKCDHWATPGSFALCRLQIRLARMRTGLQRGQSGMAVPQGCIPKAGP